jgi:hypothetical protein
VKSRGDGFGGRSQSHGERVCGFAIGFAFGCGCGCGCGSEVDFGYAFGCAALALGYRRACTPGIRCHANGFASADDRVSVSVSVSVSVDGEW